MANFYRRNTEILEDRNLTTLRLAGLQAEKNNGARITETDFFCEGVLCDFQYSCAFDRYRDVRVDVVSAYCSPMSRRVLQDTLRQNISDGPPDDLLAYLGNFMAVQKVGKFFDPSLRRPEYVLYWFFTGGQEKLNPEKDHPVAIYRADTRMLEHYLQQTWKMWVRRGRLRLNNKRGLGDRHGSAFFALPVWNLEGEKDVFKRCPDLEILAKASVSAG